MVNREKYTARFKANIFRKCRPGLSQHKVALNYCGSLLARNSSRLKTQ